MVKVYTRNIWNGELDYDSYPDGTAYRVGEVSPTSLTVFNDEDDYLASYSNFEKVVVEKENK